MYQCFVQYIHKTLYIVAELYPQHYICGFFVCKGEGKIVRGELIIHNGDNFKQ